MSTHQAFEINFADLVTEVSTSVNAVADECRAASIISSETYAKVINVDQKTDQDKARTLLTNVSSSISVQVRASVNPEECKFTKFVGILKKEPSLHGIAERLESTRVDIDNRAKLDECTEDTRLDTVDSGVVRDESVSASATYLPQLQEAFNISGQNVPSLQFFHNGQQTMNINHVAVPTAESSEGSRSPRFYVGGQNNSTQDLRTQNLELKVTNAEKELKIQKLEKRLEETIQEKSKAEHKLKEAEQRILGLSQENAEKIANLKRKIEDLQDSVADQEKENARLKEEYESKITDLKKEIEKKKELYDENMLTLTNQKCDLRIEVMDFELKEKELQRQIEEAKRETAEARIEAAEARTQAAEARTQAAQAKEHAAKVEKAALEKQNELITKEKDAEIARLMSLLQNTNLKSSS